MINIELNYNNAYKWNRKENIYSIGYIYYKNNFYRGEQLSNLLSEIKIQDLEQFIDEIDGPFTFVIENEDEIILISDLLRNFPVFYSVDNNLIEIRDNIMEYEHKILDENSEIELSYVNYVTGYTTIFKNIYQLEAHQIVKINKMNFKIERNKYFDYKYNFNDKNDDVLIRELDEIYDRVIKKVIKYLDGRQAVIPLSGGNDSRLIAYYLTKNNYKNVIAYTYGSEGYSEIETSRKVAEFLGIKWYFIEYKNRSMQKKFNDKRTYKSMADYCGRGYSTPHIQEWEAITNLMDRKIITKESIIIPGFSGDFLCGSHIHDDLYSKDKVTPEELIKSIYRWQYVNASRPIENTNIKDKIKYTLSKDENESLSRNDAIKLFEKFDFEERQTKFVNNAIRTYDYQGLQWYLPFWDKELILKWLSIPLEKRYSLELFNKFTKTIYNDLMEYAPIYKIEFKSKIEPPFRNFKKIYRIYDIYKNGFLNFYGYLYFRTYIKYFIKTKNYAYNKIFSCYYIGYIKKEIKKDNKIIKEG